MAAKKEKIIGVKEYVALANVTAASISYRIKRNQILPGISRYYFDINNRCYSLVRDESIKDEDIKRYFREKAIA